MSVMEHDATTTITNVIEHVQEQTISLHLRLRKPSADKKVSWHQDTVDNEDMNKHKSKCCCIYHKPYKFDESSSESEDECGNCRGHCDLII